MQAVITVAMLAVGLSMDAFAVSICKGLCMDRADSKKCAIVGLWFGGFQALMPLIGYLVGTLFADKIEKFDHWIAFALLTIIGLTMIKEAFEKDEGDVCDVNKNSASLSFKVMLIMAIATSIDALASGVALAFDGSANIFAAVAAIGVITFAMSFVGVKIGNIFGSRYKFISELAGGIILIGLGIKILITHLVA